MKTYLTLIKQTKADIKQIQKEMAQANQDKRSLEHQIEHMLETLEREHLEVSFHKTFFNPAYFDRMRNKLKAYRQLLQTKDEELTVLHNVLMDLFASQKKYEVVLEHLNNNTILEKRKEEAAQLEDVVRLKDSG